MCNNTIINTKGHRPFFFVYYFFLHSYQIKTTMNIQDQYLDLCEARVEALTNEVILLQKYIIRDASLKGISAQAAMDMFKAFKENETKI